MKKFLTDCHKAFIDKNNSVDCLRYSCSVCHSRKTRRFKAIFVDGQNAQVTHPLPQHVAVSVDDVKLKCSNHDDMGMPVEVTWD